MVRIYSILKIIFPKFLYIYLQNKKRLAGLPNEIKSIVRSLNSNDICVDCGANVGVYSQLFASYGAKVYAFEPDPIPYEKLKEKEDIYKNLVSLMSAVGIQNQKTKLYLDNKYNDDKLFYSEHNSLVKEKNNVGNSFITVNVIDFAEWVKKFKKIKFIKIDIEGYEINLINHLIDEKAIDRIDYIFLETHEKRIEGLNLEIIELKQKIKNLGIEKKFFWNWP